MCAEIQLYWVKTSNAEQMEIYGIADNIDRSIEEQLKKGPKFVSHLLLKWE